MSELMKFIVCIRFFVIFCSAACARKSGAAELDCERESHRRIFLCGKSVGKRDSVICSKPKTLTEAAQIIAEKGGEWIASGAITTLDNFIGKIPLEFLEKFPRALLHKAEIARLQGEIDKIFESSAPRHETFWHKNKDKDRRSRSPAFAGESGAAQRQMCDAFDYLEKAEKLVAEDSETFLKCANTRGLCLVAQGAWTNAEHQFRYALELAEKQSNDHFIRLITHNLALPAGFRGDFGEALRWLKRIFSDSKSTNSLPQEAIGHLNVARLHLYRGEFDETEKHLERALEICQIFNLKSLRGEIFEAYGNFYREKADFPHAGEFYERALKAYEDAAVDLTTREFDEERAKFYLLRGDTIKARGLLENLLAARIKTNNDFGIKTVKLALCRVQLAQNETDGLPEQIKELVTFFQEQNLNYDEAVSSFLLAETYFALGNRKKMLPPLQRALDLAARLDYEYWLRSEIQRNPRLFADEEVIEKLPLDLREIVERRASIVERKNSGENAVINSPLSTSDVSLSTITDLTVKVLGFVEIYRDETKPFATDAWTTKRARDIFCFIATSKNRRVEKDVLIDTFWSADELETIEKNFHPTISHIRKALNSRQSFKQNFLLFRDGAYQLNPELVLFD